MSDLLSGLGNLAKSVTSNISTYEIRKIGEKMQDMVMNFTEAEVLVRDATNEDPWGPTGPQMKEISHLTYQYDQFHQVMSMIWKRMLEDNKYAWRRVYKSLTLLNYLLQHGSERVINSAKDHVYQMRSLEHYKFLDEKGKDQGINIRHRAKLILELLQDDDAIRDERNKAKKDNKEKYQGYTSDDIRMGRGGQYSSSSNANSFSSSSFNSHSNQRYDDEWTDKKQKSDEWDNGGKEVNSFKFPEDAARRDSISPELGFKQEKVGNDDDDFGDFAAARGASAIPKATTTTATRVGAAAVPSLPPPSFSSPAIKPAAPAPSGGAFDLLGLDAPAPAAVSPAADAAPVDFFSSVPVQTTSAARPPRPPSGGAPVTVAGGGDLFGDFSAPPPPAASQPALIDDLFGAPVAAPTLTSPMPAPINANSMMAFGDFGSMNAAPPQPAPVHNDLFGDWSGSAGGSLSLSATSTLQPSSGFAPVAVATPKPATAAATTTTAATPSKLGSTWADTSGLINLDNLGSKGTQVKQSLSLNQIQKGGAAPSGKSDFPW